MTGNRSQGTGHREQSSSRYSLRLFAVTCSLSPVPIIISRMHLARVIGRVVATVKQETLSSVALHWIQPITADDRIAGKPIVAVDRIGVGPGETVYYVTSREASLTLENKFAAVDAGIVGRVDWANVKGQRTLWDGSRS